MSLGNSSTGKGQILYNQEESQLPECWSGIRSPQLANEWLDTASLTPFQAISGLNDYGQDADDEAKLIGTDDGAFRTGSTQRKITQLLITSLSTDTPWKLRVVWGTGTLAAAIAAQQFTCRMVINITSGSKAGGTPIKLVMPWQEIGVCKFWLIAKNATDDAAMDVLIGIIER